MAERPQRVLLLRRLLARLPPGRLPARAAGLRPAHPPVRHLSDALAAAYVDLVLRVARAAPGLVDTALPLPDGPAEPWPVLAGAAARVRRDLGVAGTGRERWLAGQLDALAVHCDVRAGRSVPWQEQVERCLGVAPSRGDRETYRACHEELARLLPGAAPLRERLAAHRRATEVPADRLHAALVGVVRRLRATAPELPAGEGLRVEVVSRSASPARCTATGPLSSTVAFDGRRRWTAAGLLATAAHEAYPGHHTERVLLHDLPERAVAVVATPESVVSEGLGETALRASGLQVRDVAALLALPADVDPALVDAVAAAAAPLQRTKTDAAVLLHTRGPAAARDHLARWGLHDDARADAQLAFLSDPRWAVHAVAYGTGADLVGAHLDAGGAYRDLLGRPLRPADLRR